MINQSLSTPIESAATPRGLSLEARFVIVALAVLLAVAADFVFHTIWLPSLTSQLAVQQLRPDDTVAQVVRGVTLWANWSHALLAIIVGVFALLVLNPFKERPHRAHQHEQARNQVE